MLDITRKVLNHHSLNLEGNLFTAVWKRGYSIVAVKDEYADFEDLCGDSFNPEVNSSIPKSRLLKEKREYKARFENEGVYGIGLAFEGGPQYETFIWGFVGDDYLGSGYDSDLIDALELKGVQQ